MADQERPLGEMVRELLSLLGQYVRQLAADTVEEVLMRPLRRAAVGVLVLGVALGLAVMAAVCLALALFHSLSSALGGPCPAWAITGVACLLAAGICVWLVLRGSRHASSEARAARDRRRPGPPVEPDPAAAEPRDDAPGSDPGAA